MNKQKVDAYLPKNPLLKGVLEQKLCTRCKCLFPRTTAAFFRNKARPDGLSVPCKKCHQAATNAISVLKRDAVFALLGSRCRHCNFADKRALQIDHIHGGGHTDRGALSPSKYYDKILSIGKERYQILCANCNTIKRIEEKEHRGRLEVFPETAMA